MNARNWLWHDHRDYEALLRAFASVAGAAEWAAAEERLQDLVSLLKGHFQVEEEVLFPSFEELVDVQGAPTRTLRGEHDLIRDLLERLSATIGKRDGHQVAEIVTRLEEVMSQHHQKEEEIFLPRAQDAFLARILGFT